MQSMKLGFLAVAVVSVGSLLAGGCSATTSSRNIRTGGIVAIIDVTSERSGESTVDSTLVIGGQNSNTHVMLEGGDRMYAKASGKQGKRREMNAVDAGHYEAKFAVGEGEYAVALERDVDTKATGSKGTLPPPFEITSDFGNKPISRKKSFEVTWSPGDSAADIEIAIAGDCILDATFKVGADPGKYEIKGGALEAWKGHEKESCTATVTITSTTKGTTDPAFDSDSVFELHQVRSARFVSGK